MKKTENSAAFLWRCWVAACGAFPEPAGGVVFLGLAGLMMCQYTYFLTIQYSNAGIATVIQYLSPVMILFYVCLRARRKPHPGEMVGGHKTVTRENY